MNQIFLKFYEKKLFTLKEATKIIKNYQVCKNNLKRLQTKNHIRRIKNAIYHIVPLDNPDFYPNTIHIASQLRKDPIVCCNSALFVHSLWKSEDTIYIMSKYASKIRIKQHTYKILKEPDNFGIEKIEYNTGYTTINIRITDMERSVIDCLRTRSIKTDDIITMLRTKKPELSIKKILKYLDKYKKPILYNKIGLVLDSVKLELKITDEDLLEIKKKLSKKTFYLKEKELRLIKPKYKYYQKWNMMITENIYNIVQPKTVSTVL